MFPAKQTLVYTLFSSKKINNFILSLYKNGIANQSVLYLFIGNYISGTSFKYYKYKLKICYLYYFIYGNLSI